MKLRKLLFGLLIGMGATVPTQAQSFYICNQGNTETASELTFTNNGTTLNGTISTASIDSITTHVPALRFVGGDISLLTKYEEQRAQYKDKDGKTISDVLQFLKEQGWNTMRVRIFVDPVKGLEITDENNKKEVVQDLEYVKSLGHRIKEAGLLFMLDFHYSDTYADPAQQWTPDSWKSLNNDELAAKIYEYTRDCLSQLNAAGASPDFIQTGNEISYGMCWGTKQEASGNSKNRCYSTSDAANWNRFFSLLRQATKACREECPRAQIIIHSERTPRPGVLTDYFDRMKNAGIDYDIIGLSYYPYFHGNFSVLSTALRQLNAKNYGKSIQIVETGFPSKWAVPGSTETLDYALSAAGQKQYTADLISLLKEFPQVNGLSWWWAEANAKGCTGDLNSGWYNAGLFNNETGRALDALYELKNFR